MKQYLLSAASAAILLTLLFASQTNGQTTVDSVDGLKTAIENAVSNAVININGTIAADETDMMYSDGQTDPTGWNESYKRAYWYGYNYGSTDSEDIQQSGLTLQGTDNATLSLNLDAPGDAGAIMWLKGFSDLTLNDLTLTGGNTKKTMLDSNTIEEYGSVNFYQTTGTKGLTLNNVTVKNNSQIGVNTAAATGITTSGMYAGGVYVMGASKATFTDTVFDNNTVAYYEESPATSAAGGPAFSAQAGGLYLSNANTFSYTGGGLTNNKSIAKNARADGGGLILYTSNATAGSTGTFSNTVFSNNSATSAFDVDVAADGTMTARGGAATINSEIAAGETSVLDAVFTGITVNNNSANVDAGSKDTGASSEAIGGGFAITGQTKTTFKNSVFENNIAEFSNGIGTARGGAIAVKDILTEAAYGNATLNVDNVSFTNNTASSDQGAAMGGAVSIHQTKAGTTVTSSITGSTFSGNTATSTSGSARGGAIYNVGTSPLTITDTSFYSNTASGISDDASGGAIYSENDLTIKAAAANVFFSNNRANNAADSVHATKNLAYDIAADRTITDNDKITVGGNLTKTGEGNLNVREADITGNLAITKGDNTFGLVHVGGSTAITDAIVTIQNVEESQLGSSTTLTQSTLILGDAAAGDVFEGSFTLNDSDVQGGIFTAWKQQGTSGLVASRLTEANMSDGFLAAFGMHSRNTVWKAVRDQMISGSGRYQVRPVHYGNGYYGQESFEADAIPFETSYESTPYDPCAPVACDPCAPIAVAPALSPGISPNTAWVTYTGRNSEYRSSYNNRNWDTSMEGLQVGTDLFRTKYAQLGLLFGSEDGKSNSGWDKVEADDLYLGVYAAAVLQGGADIRGVFGYGWQDYDMNRWQDSANLYRSSFKGRTMEGNLEIGKRYASGPWSLRPALGVDVISNEIKGTAETGYGMNAIRYGKTDMTQLFVRAGTDLRYRARGFTLNSGIYYAYDVNGGDDLNTRVSSLDGLYSSQLMGTQLGRSLLLFNLGGSLQLTRNIALIGGYQGESVLDGVNEGVQSTGYIGGSWRW